MRRLSAVMLLPAFVALAVGCSGDRNDRNDKAAVKVAFNDDSASMPALGPNDVRIVSKDGSFEMAVVGDTVRMQLSDSVRRSVAQSIDTAADAKSDLGAAITRSVGKVVSSAMGFVVRIPVEDIENLRNENGHLRFDVRGGKVKVESSTDKSGSNAEFSDEDARRFIEAVQRRQRAKHT
jgi:hypothetical protein